MFNKKKITSVILILVVVIISCVVAAITSTVTYYCSNDKDDDKPASESPPENETNTTDKPPTYQGKVTYIKCYYSTGKEANMTIIRCGDNTTFSVYGLWNEIVLFRTYKFWVKDFVLMKYEDITDG